MSFLGSDAGSVAGSLINSAFSGLNASTSYHYNLKLAKAVNTNKHQWEVSDLRKAGLNPILSANSTGFANAGSVAVSSSDMGLGSAEASSNTSYKLGKEANKINQQNADTNSAVGTSTISRNAVSADNETRSTDANVTLMSANEKLANANEQRAIAGIINDREVAHATAYNLIRQGDAAVMNANTNQFSAFSQDRLNAKIGENWSYKNKQDKAATNIYDTDAGYSAGTWNWFGRVLHGK